MIDSTDSLFRSMLLCSLILIIEVSLVPQLAAETPRPNIVMIVVDDLRFDEFGAGGHPYLETPHIDRLAEEGALFSRAYHATPLCSPNRASLLTGQYASRHGILDNTSRSHASHRLNLFPKELRDAGYVTAHIGKWHMGNDPTPRPGYDYWVSIPGQGQSFDPYLAEEGRIHQSEGYITDIFTDRAVKFIKDSAHSPFFLYIGHKALHPDSKQLDDASIDLSVHGAGDYIPAERHQGRYVDKTFERRPNYGFSAEEQQSKPVIKQALEMRDAIAVNEAWVRKIDFGISEETIRRRAEMMLAVDESVGRIVETLKQTDELDNTLIIFTSDNGFFYGEHGLTIERRLPYEESARTPLLMRYPKLIQPGTTVNGLAVSIDIAPTVLDVAGVEIPDRIQGKSLVPLLQGETDEVHDSILIEYYSHENPFPWTANLDYRCVRTGKYKYVRWIRFDEEAELYDLDADPYELKNLVHDPSMAAVVKEVNKKMRRLVLESLGLND